MRKTITIQARWIGVGFLLASLILFPEAGIGEELRRSQGRLEQNAVPAVRVTQAEESRLCPAQLSSAIEATLHHPSLQRSRWGVSIQTFAPNGRKGNVLYERSADRYFIPASNAKLLVTAAALHRLGPKLRLRTAINGAADRAATDPGSDTAMVLRFQGQGDPSLTQTHLADLARQLHRQGIRQVSELAVERDRFQGPTVNPTWEWGDLQFPYAPRINSLILTQNATRVQFAPRSLHQPLQIVWSDPLAASQWQIRNQAIAVEPNAAARIAIEQHPGSSVLTVKGQLPLGAVPVSANLALPNPDLYFVKHLRQALKKAGIVVDRIVLTTRADKQTNAQMQELAAVESPSLAQLLLETNHNSNNLYAEVLLRQLGAVFEEAEADLFLQDSVPSTAARGLAAVKQILTALGVDAESYQLADGSGLSRHNQVSPEALVQTLQAMAQSPYAAVYRNSLAVAGVSGTLRHRFRRTPVAGKLWGKTGTLSGTVALSGYLEPPHYEPLVFSLMLNHGERSVRELRSHLDRIVLLLARLRAC